MKSILTLCLLLVMGCSMSIRVQDVLSDDPAKLKQQIAALETEVAGYEESLVMEKEAREFVAKAAANATGFFDRDSAMTKLGRANSKVSQAAWFLQVTKSRLAEAKAKLNKETK